MSKEVNIKLLNNFEYKYAFSLRLDIVTALQHKRRVKLSIGKVDDIPDEFIHEVFVKLKSYFDSDYILKYLKISCRKKDIINRIKDMIVEG